MQETGGENITATTPLFGSGEEESQQTPVEEEGGIPMPEEELEFDPTIQEPQTELGLEELGNQTQEGEGP
jgi:hypothetical protein